MIFNEIKRSIEKQIFGSGTKGSSYYERSRWNGHSFEKNVSFWKKINKFGLRNKIHLRFDDFKKFFSQKFV